MTRIASVLNLRVNPSSDRVWLDRWVRAAFDGFDRFGTVLGGAVLTQQQWLNANPGMAAAVHRDDTARR